jgi:glycosyltransferase involved in cell wall biosynthesis
MKTIPDDDLDHLRLLALVPNVPDTGPSQRYRIEEWDPYLRQEGISIEYAPFESKELNEVIYQGGKNFQKGKEVVKSWMARRNRLSDLKSYDLVYVLRECTLIGPDFFENMIRRAGLPYVFDFDDAVFLRYVSASNGLLSLLKFGPSNTVALCRHAVHVIAGNRYLGEYASRYNQNVTVVPSTIDTEKYALAATGENEIPIVGWTGSYSTVAHLQSIAPALKALAEQISYRLRVIGAGDFKLDGVDVDARPWRSSSEVSDLRPIDVGIMPLPDNEWTRYKCGMKALQYMALAKPAVCSPVGVNSEIIRHRENGLLAGSNEEWVTSLKYILDSPEERRRMGRAARLTIEEKYSAGVQAPRVAEIFKSVVRRHRAGRSRTNLVAELQNQ